MGIVSDFKRTVGTHWLEEMTVFNQKTVAVSLLMFITVIAPTLTFGAVYGKSTGSNIGTVETILATAWSGIFFALLSGMPMVRSVFINSKYEMRRQCSNSFCSIVLCLYRLLLDRQALC
jgi:hypothetical protein